MSTVLNFPSPRPCSTTPDTSTPGDAALLGPSPAIAQVWSQIRRVAPHFRAAAITGEPGTGAEAAAHALHALSPIARLPFHIISSDSALAPGAASFNDGLLFVPEVDRLSLDAQRALLRKLRLRARSLRIVATTKSDLRAAVSAGTFSAELAETLSAVRITLPALRDRREDIPMLASHIVHRLAERSGVRVPALADSFHQATTTFDWPGNLLQLESIFEHLLQQHPTTLTMEDFDTAAAIVPALKPADTPAPVRMVRLDDIVQDHIRAVLIACHGNKLRAAEVLGISRSTLYRMLDANPLPIAI